MDLSHLAKSLESPEPVYLLKENQAHIRSKVYEVCLDHVEEGQRAFNWTVYDLEKDSVVEVLNTANTLPWLAQHRFVYVKNANLEADKLNGYLKNPSLRTVLILEVKKVPRGWSKLPSVEMSETGSPLRWVTSRVEQEGYEVDRRAVEVLVELVGDNYQQLELELEKQFLSQVESREITLDSVLEMTQQTREYDVFALITALAGRNSSVALHVLNSLFSSGMAAPQIVSMLYWNFRRVLVAREMLDAGKSFRSILPDLKIWSYKDREAEIRSCSIELLSGILLRLRETDRLCKTTSTDPRLHLERVVIDTCGGDSYN